MSPDALALKKAIEDAKLGLKEAHKALWELLHHCSCEFRPLTKQEFDDKWMSVSSECLICGEHHGWRCKKSPDGVCHYRIDANRMVTLVDQSLCEAPKGYDPRNYGQCVFCMMPEERK